MVRAVTPATPPVDRQAGFTLTELMIAGSLGVIILLGLTQLWASAHHTDRTTQALARMQEDARYALDVMEHFLSAAGRQHPAPVMHGLTVAADTADATALPPITAAHTGDHEIQIQLRTLAGERDCTGAASARAAVTRIRFMLDGDDLECEVNGGIDQALISGVTDFSLRYGFDGNDDGSPDYYERLAAIPDLTGVIAVRISLTLSDAAAAPTLGAKTFVHTIAFANRQ